jgi:glutathione peroxidase-family protein
LQYLKSQLPVSEGGGGGSGPGQDIGWNFYSRCKASVRRVVVGSSQHISACTMWVLLHAEFLVDQTGDVVKRFTQEYHADEVESAIYRLLFRKQ